MCLCVRVYACVSECMCMYMCARARTCVYAHAHCVCTRVYTCVCMCGCVHCERVYGHVYVCTHGALCPQVSRGAPSCPHPAQWERGARSPSPRRPSCGPSLEAGVVGASSSQASRGVGRPEHDAARFTFASVRRRLRETGERGCGDRGTTRPGPRGAKWGGTPHLTPRTSSTCRRPVPRAAPVPATRWDFLSDSRQRPLSPPSDTQPQPPRRRVHGYTEGSARATAVFTVAVQISWPFNGVTGCCHVHQVLIEVSATLTPQPCGFMCDLAQGADLYELPGCITAKASVCLESFVPGEMTGQIRIRGGHLIPQEDGERLQERDRAGSDGGQGPPAEECPQGAHVLVPGTSEPHLAWQRNLAAVTKLRTQTRASTLPHLDGPWTYSGGWSL